MRFQSTLLITVALCIAACLASSGTDASDKYLSTFEQIPSPNFGRVNGILRDDRGFLWFGTDRGLCKFDGYQVRVFAIESTPENKRQIITSIISMKGGRLLLATGNGLWTFDLKTEQLSQFLPGTEIPRSRINAIVQGPDSTIWIGTSSLGLFSYNTTSTIVRRYTTSDGLSANRILTLLLDHSGGLWIGTTGGGLNLLETATSRIVHYRSTATDSGTLYSDNITSLCENVNQELWIGTSEGLNVLDLETQRMRRVDLHSYTRHTIMSLARDPFGRMWIAALDLGLLFYDNGSLTQFTTSDDVDRSLNSVRTLYPDPVATTGRSLLLWIGTRHGVNKVLMATNPFTNHIRNQDSLLLHRGAVLALCEDRKGILWTGLWGGGLDAFKQVNGAYRRVANFKSDASTRFSLPHNDVGPIIEDRNENLWIGTSGGIAVLDKTRKQMVVYKHIEGDSTSLLSNQIDDIYEDHSGTIWICTIGGLSELRPGTPHRFRNYLIQPKVSDTLEGKQVSDIFQDRLSNLWVATYGRGLTKLEPDGKHVQFLHPADTSGIQENWIYSLVEDNDGLFWLSTRIGLASFDPRSGLFTRHAVRELSDAHIFGIFVDQQNNLWLSTETGLARFSPKAQSFTRFDESYGIGFTELRSGFFQNTQGKLFVGGLDGFTEFYPDSIFSISSPPEIAITSWSVFDQELPATSTLPDGEIHFSYDQNFLSFSFAALDYANPQRNRFAYRMVGVDNDWVDAGTRNYASYAHLNAGNYVFQVKGCNSNNVWNETGASISFIITPPYWQAWWFRILVAGLFASTIYAVYRYRLRKLLEVERLRLRIADDLHDDVGSNLSAIAMVSRAVQRAPELTPTSKAKIAEIYNTAVLTSQGMKDLVWFIKPENDSLGDLILRMKDTASTLLSETELHFHSPKPDDSRAIAIDFKRSVFLAFKEIVTNIAKHAMATKVEINVTLIEGMFEMRIADNGKGFVERDTQPGNGLQSLRKRARSIRGTCEITSLPGNGTTVTFTGKM